MINVNNPFELIAYTASNYPTQLAMFPLYNPADPARSMIHRTRIRKRGVPTVGSRMPGAETVGEMQTVELATMLCAIPSDVARNIRGPVDERDVLWMFLIRRYAYDRAASGLIVPAEQPGRIIV